MIQDTSLIYDGQVALMLSHINGANIYTKKFDNTIGNEQLLSGALSAVISLFQESLPINKLYFISINDLNILYSGMENIVFYYLFKGDIEVGEQRFTEFMMQMMQSELWGKIANLNFKVTKEITDDLEDLVSDLL